VLYTLSLHDALPIWAIFHAREQSVERRRFVLVVPDIPHLLTHLGNRSALVCTGQCATPEPASKASQVDFVFTTKDVEPPRQNDECDGVRNEPEHRDTA